ncbi:uncharacterized protein B4U80_01927 [Leptotrombidium deliense]|uniref:BTB/POZ domain-containing protein 9-like protein n=1 Tax=Leptotrombidium deliense TaxID=299467 RepID=A0A443SW03_9ACAR|nr:uncharacterized protein B4U80_01927 [Leptotrombidium deliense]
MSARKVVVDQCLLGVPRLLDDLERLAGDRDSCDILFIAGREEVAIYAHRLILKTRQVHCSCTSFQNLKRGEICKVFGTTVSLSTPGNPIPIRLPQVKPDVLRDVLFYVYCGRVLLQDSNVFEVLAICCELGIDDLRQFAEDHIRSSLCIHNACTYLPAALELETRIPDSKSGRCFKDRCTAFIGENAMECIKTPSFLTLPKEALIHLISSDCVALEEEDVWRAVLNWAKHNTGVMQPTAHWTEEERTRVCQQLSGVINHVRILLIDSHVFAEEVEPTGAVPMEISLERYRSAALPNKFGYTEERKVQPRSSLKLFQSSQILTGDKLQYQRVLNSWFGVNKQAWKLLYRASTHGYSSDSFHHHCDGHFPTYVLVFGANGEICGGFSDVPWNASLSSRGRYVSSEKSFLFTLVNNVDVPPTKFDIVKKAFAIVNHPDFGPVFGAGADFSISSNCNSNMDSYSNLPHSYDGENASCTLLMGDYNFTVFDYEVFTIDKH